MSKEGVLQIIESVQDAVSKECWIPALAVALTLPDIMGQVEFPEMVFKGGKRKVGEQYRTWFAEHVEHHFVDEQGWDKDYQPINPYFTADMCWQLRCSVLHQGGDDIKHEYNFENKGNVEYEYGFELRINACNSYGAMWVEPFREKRTFKTIRVCINIKTLCQAICEEALSFLEVSNNDFNDMGIKIADVSRIRSIGFKR